MGQLERRHRRDPKPSFKSRLAAAGIEVVAAIFVIAGLYAAITTPWEQPINPIVDVVRLFSDLFDRL